MEKMVLNGSACFCEAQKMPAGTPGSASGRDFGYAEKEGDGWENSHLLHSLTSAARVLLVTEALPLSLFLSQVLVLVPDRKLQSPDLEGLCGWVLLIHASTSCI